MTVIRKSELLEMSEEALLKKLSELEQEVSVEKGLQKTTGKPANHGKFREMKRVVARIKTILKQRSQKI